MRKHLIGGRVLSAEQPNFDRIININIESSTEMGDLTVKTLIIEIMGKHSNVILTKDDLVLDSIKRVGFDISSVREVLPGKRYVLPPAKGKRNPLELNKEEFLSLFGDENDERKTHKTIYENYSGISPAAANEICFRAGEPGEKGGKGRLFDAFSGLMSDVSEGRFKPQAITDETGKLIEFSPIVFTMYANPPFVKRYFADISSLLEFYYAERSAKYHMAQRAQDLRKLITSNIERLTKKIGIHEKTLAEAENREKWRLWGELITANIYAVKKGMKEFECVNFYDAESSLVTVPLDAQKTPAENAQRYFKRYNKDKRAAVEAAKNIEISREELFYLDGVLTALSAAAETADIDDIRAELVSQGFAKRKTVSKGKEKPKKSKPIEYISKDGFAILVGKNNAQNDELTMRIAEAADIWLHAKEIAGSHVIIRADGKPVPNGTVEQAAEIAAYYSKARESSVVPVDYCPRRNVRKPNGARPGFVIYDNYKTAYVKPSLP
jgi:predicted ribosome quality control (RQC) complex YloA/Tae2 family protein